MSDPRINQIQELITSMEQGESILSEEIPGNDDIGRLGQSLHRLSQTIDQKFQYQLKILEFSQKLNEGLFLTEVLDYVYRSFKNVIPYNRIGFALLENEGKVLRAHWHSSDFNNISLDLGFSQKMKGSSLNQIIQSREPRIINDLEQYLIEKPESTSTRLIVSEGILSSLTCPLISKNKPVGFLFFSSAEKNCYANIHQDSFSILASQLSTVVEKSQLYEELFEMNKELNESRDSFKLQATHDALTGLWNRGTICQLLEKEIARASRNQNGVALLMIDIDHFKPVNDLYGHPAGDVVLKEVANRFKLVARSEDSVARYGGEEFIVVFAEIKRADLESVAERYRRVIEETPFSIPDKILKLTISLGLAWVPAANEVSEESIIELADRALYSAKNAGRNQLCINELSTQ